MQLTPRKYYCLGQYATLTQDEEGDYKVEIKAKDYACENGLDEAIGLLDAMWRDLGEALGYEISAEGEG